MLESQEQGARGDMHISTSIINALRHMLLAIVIPALDCLDLLFIQEVTIVDNKRIWIWTSGKR